MTDLTSTTNRQWRWKLILGWHLIAGMLVVSWWLPGTQQVWEGMDVWVARTLNNLLAHGQAWQMFWAIANARLFDGVTALMMMAILWHYVYYSGPKETLGRRLAESAFIGMMMLVVLGFTREFIFKGVHRDSPSLVLEPFYLLTDLLPDLKAQINFKVASDQSFPGDHAGALAMFVALLWSIAGWRHGAVGLCLAGLFALPRLFGGAHWLTDVIMGGTVTAIVATSWAIGTPFAHWVISWLEKQINTLGQFIHSHIAKHAPPAKPKSSTSDFKQER